MVNIILLSQQFKSISILQSEYANQAVKEISLGLNWWISWLKWIFRFVFKYRFVFIVTKIIPDSGQWDHIGDACTSNGRK